MALFGRTEFKIVDWFFRTFIDEKQKEKDSAVVRANRAVNQAKANISFMLQDVRNQMKEKQDELSDLENAEQILIKAKKGIELHQRLETLFPDGLKLPETPNIPVDKLLSDIEETTTKKP